MKIALHDDRIKGTPWRKERNPHSSLLLTRVTFLASSDFHARSRIFFAHLRDSFYLVHERRLPRPSQSMYFGDVSETKGWDTHSEIKKLARKT